MTKTNTKAILEATLGTELVSEMKSKETLPSLGEVITRRRHTWTRFFEESGAKSSDEVKSVIRLWLEKGYSVSDELALGLINFAASHGVRPHISELPVIETIVPVSVGKIEILPEEEDGKIHVSSHEVEDDISLASLSKAKRTTRK